jgi:hypothetical protein
VELITFTSKNAFLSRKEIAPPKSFTKVTIPQRCNSSYLSKEKGYTFRKKIAAGIKA